MFDPCTATTLYHADNRRTLFNPASISGLVVWLKSTAGLFQDSGKTTPVTANNDKVGAWADQSGNGNDIVQATSLNRPTYKTNIINGLPAVLFAGDPENLQKTFGAAYAQPNTVIQVFQCTEATNTGPTFDAKTSQNEQFDSTNWSVAVMRAYAGAVLSTTTVSDVTNFHIVSIVFNGNSGVLRYNKAEEATGAIGAQTLDGLTLGMRGGGTNFFVGYVPEILVYNAALTTPQLVAVEGYLASRYRL